jgi:putative thiosulfate sulfurtransferase
MRKKLLMLAATVMATLLLTGCFTLALLSKSIRYKEDASDELLTFAEVSKENPNIVKGSLIMQGREYWFVIEPRYRENQENLEILHKVLTESWSGLFSLTDESGLKSEDHLEIRADFETIGSDERSFNHSSCLRYQTNRTEEEKRLEQMGFKYIKEAKVWHHCFELTGTVYKSPQDKMEQQHLRNALPIKIMVPYEGNQTTPLHIIALPFALAADVVIAVPAVLIMGEKLFNE